MGSKFLIILIQYLVQHDLSWSNPLPSAQALRHPRWPSGGYIVEGANPRATDIAAASLKKPWEKEHVKAG
jgi:hypothetical protein